MRNRKLSHFRTLVVGVLAVPAVGGIGTAYGQEDADLTVVSWGGVYQESQRKAYFNPFADSRGIEVAEVNYGGDYSKLSEQVESGEVTWDVVDVTLSNAIRGCENGELEPIPPTILEPAPDGSEPMQDFLQNTLHECAVGQYIWSTVWAYNENEAGNPKPETLEDIFNLDRYSGERGMRKTPNNNIEWALMADGVSPDDVYAELNTSEGIDRAFDKLDSIRDSIRWWEDGSKPQEWLSAAEVTFSTGYNGRIFDIIVNEGEPVDYIWDGQMLQIEAWVIPRGAPNLKNALDFIQYATRTQSMAELTEHLSYAPARKSSLPLVRREYQRHMPTSPVNRRSALQSSFVWWSENQEDMDERFDAWLGQG